MHGHQEGRFFHGSYGDYCFLPLYVFCGEQLLVSYLRPSRKGAARPAWAILKLLVARLRTAWPQVRIILRADSGFCRWKMLHWCEWAGLTGTELARAQVITIRPRLLKLGTVIVRDTRRIRLFFSSAFPHQAIFRRAWAAFSSA